MSYQLIDATYDYRKNRPTLKFYNTKDDSIKIWIDKFIPYFIVKDLSAEESNLLNSHTGYKGYKLIEKKDSFTHKGDEYIKIFAKTKQDLYELRNLINDKWEEKIPYIHSYLYDNNFEVGMLYDFENNRPIIKHSNPDLYKQMLDHFKFDNAMLKRYAVFHTYKFSDDIPKPKMVAFDIEVGPTPNGLVPNSDKSEQQVISCSFVSTNGLRLVYILKRGAMKFGKEYKDYDGINQFFISEKIMLLRIFRVIREFPVCITFNGDNFDMPYLYNRAIRLGIHANQIPFYIKAGWGYMNKKECVMKQNIHIDLFTFFIKKPIQLYAFGNKYERFGLTVISQALLSEGKHEHKDTEIDEMSINELAYYNLKDSDLTLRLITHDNYLVWNLIILICRISNLGLHDMLHHEISAWIRSVFYNEHRNRNILIPNYNEIQRYKKGGFSKAIIDGKGYRGAYVIEPKAGKWYQVVVMDFASLYPSIIKECNLSYETIDCGHPSCKSNEIKGTPYYSCEQRMGITSYIVGFLRDIRVKHFKPDHSSYSTTIQKALKVFINGSYGVFGSENFALYCLPVAESITAVGFESIVQTINYCESLKVPVLYGDTDSVFLKAPTQKQIDKIEAWSKKELDLDLEAEKTFQFLALSKRKKNYVGIHDDGEKIEMKGIVGKKRNTPNFIRKSVLTLLDTLKRIKNEDDFEVERPRIVRFTKSVKKNIGNDKVYPLEDYTITTALKQEIKDYKVKTQHVKAAINSGQNYKKDDLITYVKTKDDIGVKVVELARFHDLNLKKYNDIFKTAFIQILDALGISWDEIEGQKTLDRW